QGGSGPLPPRVGRSWARGCFPQLQSHHPHGEQRNNTAVSYERKPGPVSGCVAQKKGEYRDSTCQTKSSKPKRGSFEKEGGPGYTSTIRQLTLETPGLGSGELVCAAGTAKGEITGVRAGVERITLT